MSHEPECVSFGMTHIPAIGCPQCHWFRAAYQRGREDAAKAIEAMTDKVDCRYELTSCGQEYEYVAAARGDGKQP